MCIRDRYCGTSLQEFRASGRLGCAHCYAAFDQSLRELLRRVHGATRHAGWRPVPAEAGPAGRPEGAGDLAARLDALRGELARAVAAEAFESAAALRDQIRALE